VTNVDLIDYKKKEEYPSHKGAIAGLFVVFGAFIGFGIYSLMNLWQLHETEIVAVISALSPFLANNLWLLGVGLGAIVLLSIVMALGASMAARRLGGTLIYIGAGLMNLLSWGIVLFLIITGAIPLAALTTSWPILIPGVFTLFLTLLLFTVFKDRVRRAGEIIKLTGQVTLDEKGTFVPPLLSMVFTLISALLFAGILLFFMPQILETGHNFTLDTDWGFIVGIVVYLFMTIFFYNLAYSTTSAITYIYMRGQDPSLGDGVKASLGVIGGLIVLSIMSVIVALVQIVIRAVTRKSGSVLARGAGAAASGLDACQLLYNSCYGCRRTKCNKSSQAKCRIGQEEFRRCHDQRNRSPLGIWCTCWDDVHRLFGLWSAVWIRLLCWRHRHDRASSNRLHGVRGYSKCLSSKNLRHRLRNTTVCVHQT
jgi:MFS family permease